MKLMILQMEDKFISGIPVDSIIYVCETKQVKCVNDDDILELPEGEYHIMIFNPDYNLGSLVIGVK